MVSLVCAVSEQGPLEASGVGRRVGWRGAGAAPEGEVSVPATCPCPAPAGAFTRAAREARPRSSRPAAVRAGWPPPRGLWAAGPRLWGAGWDPWAPPAAWGSEDFPRWAPSRRVPQPASRSGSQAHCALGPRR